MNAWEAIGVIASILTLAGAIVVHLMHTAKWMGIIETSLKFLTQSVESINKIIATHEANGYTKVDAAKDFAYRDKEISAMWKKIDLLDAIKKDVFNGGK